MELRIGKPGQFDVVKEDGAVLFSKHGAGRFPDAEEVLSALRG